MIKTQAFGVRLVAASLGLLLAGLACAPDVSAGNDAALRAQVENGQAVLVDVREKVEWDQGHVQGAYLLPLSVIQEWQGRGMPDAARERLGTVLRPGVAVYCHCAFGGRAVPAAEFLRSLGYDARPIDSSYRALLSAGFTETRGE